MYRPWIGKLTAGLFLCVISIGGFLLELFYLPYLSELKLTADLTCGANFINLIFLIFGILLTLNGIHLFQFRNRKWFQNFHSGMGGRGWYWDLCAEEKK